MPFTNQRPQMSECIRCRRSLDIMLVAPYLKMGNNSSNPITTSTMDLPMRSRQDARRIPQKTWETIPIERRSPLIYALGRLSVGKAMLREGFEPTEPSELDAPDKEYNIGRGTPAVPYVQRQHSLKPSLKRIAVVYQEDRSSDMSNPIPCEAPASEIMSGLLLKLKRELPEKIPKLCSALVEHIESENLLPGRSSVIKALACVRTTENVLHRKIIRSCKIRDLRNPPLSAYSIQQAYNALWMQREKLTTVWTQCGLMLVDLELPRDSKGNLHHTIIQLDMTVGWKKMTRKGFFFKPKPRRRQERRKKKKRRRPSPLRHDVTLELQSG